MRIIAGCARGRILKGPKGPGIRPTSDKVKESLFSILAGAIPGAEVLDLFCGSGALSLEAISRGAASALLVDSGKEALSLARSNTAALGFHEKTKILPLRIDSKIADKLVPHGRFSIIFADPPYAEVSPEELLTWIRPSLLKPDGILVIEHDRRSAAPEQHDDFCRVDQRKFGDTMLSFYRVKDALASVPKPAGFESPEVP